ncbi:MAG TPA: NAD-binding protein [Clostridia bacterium]|nr:NAD-binding protein [Clostridia bacterium]
MIVTIIEGYELSYTLARILRLLNHRVNIIKQESDANMDSFNEPGVNTIVGAGLDVDVLSQPCISESDVFIVLMDNDLDNLEACLYIKNNFVNKRTITKVNNPKYVRKFEQVGIDIAVNGALFTLNSISSGREVQ